MSERVTIPQNVVFKKVGDETVLLDFELGVYYGLDEVGTRVWELLAEGKTIAEAIETIADEYEVDADQARRDLDALLGELSAKGLVRLGS
jgi:hypothetical protein